MRILCFIDNLGSGGAQRQMANLAVLFKERGHYVEFLTYYPDDFFFPILQKADIPVNCINEVNPIKRILKVRRIIRSGNQDAVVSFLDTPNFITCLSAIGGRKWSLVVNELSAEVTSFTGMKGKILKLFTILADCVVCNSYNAEKMWRRYFPVFKKKMHTIYNPVIIDEEQLRIQYQPLKDGKLHIVIAASYQHLKNMHGVIEAVKLLTNEEKNKLVIDWYGRIEVTNSNTQGYDEAVKKINDYMLNGIINLYSATHDIILKMHVADIVGLFSHYEGLPNTICEGMTVGKPIIMSKVSDYKQLVDEKNGFLCDSHNPESISAALRCSINTPVEKLLEMGSLSREKANTMFDKVTVVDSYLDVIESVCIGRSVIGFSPEKRVSSAD